jgi:poly-gamma-glutamate synthesis protein (capsule biosynthesis protein)
MRRRIAAGSILICSLITACSGQPGAGDSQTPLIPTTSAPAQPSRIPTPSPSPSRTPQTSRPDNRAQAVTVVMNGDLLWHNMLWYGAHEDAVRRGRRGADAYDFGPLLAGLKPVIAAADLGICHEEVPLAATGGPYRNYPRFAAPPQVVAAISATGYDLCTTSSNHSMDQGFPGIRRTLDDLDRAGIRHVGTARSEREAHTPPIFTTKQGVKIAVVSATFSLNGLSLPAGKPWAVNMLSKQGLLDQVHRARAAGAQIVIAAVHAGTEYSTVPNAQQKSIAKALTSSGQVDLVYMHHVHVVQPWTTINGRWVVYGLGNTVAQHRPSIERAYEGVTARFTFTRRGERFTVSRAEYIPTVVTRYRPGHPARLYRISVALRTAHGAWRQQLLTAQRRTRTVVLRMHPAGLAEA